jgi:hypothetical protein
MGEILDHTARLMSMVLSFALLPGFPAYVPGHVASKDAWRERDGSSKNASLPQGSARWQAERSIEEELVDGHPPAHAFSLSGGVTKTENRSLLSFFYAKEEEEVVKQISCAMLIFLQSMEEELARHERDTA